MPILLPALGNLADPDALLDRLDGIVLTGSPTDVAPALYGRSAHPAAGQTDPERDATTLPLIRAAIRRGTPILAICRGMQELNVALGGTLDQCLLDLPGRLQHAFCQPDDAVRRIAPAHPVTLLPNGRLAGLAATTTITVNSLHRQGIDTLGAGLRIEALAPDGTIEAISHSASFFVLGLQWHPEFDTTCNPLSTAIFRAFGLALYRGATHHRLAAE